MHGRRDGGGMKRDGWMHGCMDAWMDGVLDGWRREEEMEGWMEARMEGWMDGWMGECVKEYAQPICMVYYLFPQAKGRLLLATTPPNPFARHPPTPLKGGIDLRTVAPHCRLVGSAWEI